jgi:hypothetical protein
MEKPMKAVLEFNYPQDTDQCRRAIHADVAFDMLLEIKKIAERRPTHKADLDEALRTVYERVTYVLQTTGEI